MRELNILSLCGCTSPVYFVKREVENLLDGETLRVKAKPQARSDIISWAKHQGLNVTDTEYIEISR